MSFGKVVDAVKRAESLAVMKTILEKIYVDAIVGSSSSGNVDERFTEKKKEATVKEKPHLGSKQKRSLSTRSHRSEKKTFFTLN